MFGWRPRIHGQPENCIKFNHKFYSILFSTSSRPDRGWCRSFGENDGVTKPFLGMNQHIRVNCSGRCRGHKYWFWMIFDVPLLLRFVKWFLRPYAVLANFLWLNICLNWIQLLSRMLDSSDVHSSPDQWTAAHNMVGHGQCGLCFALQDKQRQMRGRPYICC